MRRLHAHLTLALCLTASVLTAADWPQFRGPNRDGISPEVAVLKSWPAGGPKVLWKVPIGAGYSQVVSAKGRLFTLSGQGGEETAAALDAATGKEIWRVRIDRKNAGDDPLEVALQEQPGPRSTPTVD